MRKYLLQRTTLLGIFLILLAVIGVYENFLDENSAIVLLTFGATALIPENWPIAHKILTFIAPLLVHEIRAHSPSSKNQKTPFKSSPSLLSLAPFQGAFLLPHSVLARLFHQKSLFHFENFGFTPALNLKSKLKEIFMTELTTLQTTPTAPLTDNGNTPSVMSIEAQIEEILSNALGDKLTAGEKAKFHTVGAILGNVIGVLLPLTAEKIDVDSLKEGLFTLNEGLLKEEAGFKQIAASLKKK